MHVTERGFKLQGEGEESQFGKKTSKQKALLLQRGSWAKRVLLMILLVHGPNINPGLPAHHHKIPLRLEHLACF